jgi:hypothetical protein
MFDKIFCMRLELAIEISFRQSADKERRRCWCNGVILPDHDALYSIEQILKTRQLIGKAWIDEGLDEDEGLQYLYDIRLNFSDKAAEDLRTGNRLDRSIPENEFDSRIILDKQNKTIDVQLI